MSKARGRRGAVATLGYGIPASVVPVEQLASVVVEERRDGARVIGHGLRRADAVDRVGRHRNVANRLRLTSTQCEAWRWYVQALEHLETGRGLGPRPGMEGRGGAGGGEWLPPQMRALSASEFVTRAKAAMGECREAVEWVMLAGCTISDYERNFARREGWAADVVRDGLDRLAEAAGLGQKRTA